jgi:hypothetical protein
MSLPKKCGAYFLEYISGREHRLRRAREMKSDGYKRRQMLVSKVLLTFRAPHYVFAEATSRFCVR